MKELNEYLICPECSTKLQRSIIATTYLKSVNGCCDICGNLYRNIHKYQSPNTMNEINLAMKELVDTNSAMEILCGAPVSERERILRTALDATLKDRNATHGNPEDNFATIAKLWEVYLAERCQKDGCLSLLGHDVAVLNILQKISRIVASPEHEDHWVDIAGYAACGGQCAAKMKEPNESNK